jgi:ATP synthase protein I
MPTPDGPHDEARERLDRRLEAFEAERTRQTSVVAASFAGEGYRFLGEVVGGVLGGAGLGWLIDRFAHTQPLGLIGGLLIGTGLSIFVAVRHAARTMNRSAETTGKPPSVPDDEDEND